MKHFKGLAGVFVFIATYLAILFFHSVGPSVNGWLKDQQHLAGWAQAVGAIVAIWAAYLLGKMQSVAARALVREQQLVEALWFMQSTRKLLDHTKHQLRAFREGWQLRGDLHPTITECGRLRDMIANVDITRCNSPSLVEYLLQLPQLLNEAIEHQRLVSQNYTNAIVADRDTPTKRLQTFTREMNGTKSIENFIDLAIEQAEAEETTINAMRQGL